MSNLYGYIPKNSKPFTTSNIFNAAFNFPSLGKYDFTGTAANKGQVLFSTVNTSIYVISSASFSATIPEGDFLGSIDVSLKVNFPAWRLRIASDQTVLHPLPFPVVSYYQNEPFETFIYSQQLNDQILIDFTGVLNQTGALVGITSIRAQISVTYYEIVDTHWIKEYRQQSKPDFRKIG